MRGAWYCTVSATRANSASMGCMSGEWKACETFRRTERSASSRSRPSIASIAAVRPETTTLDGPLTAAIDTSLDQGAMSAATRWASAITASMLPSRGNWPIRRPRAAISRKASSSENTPATQAATYSPTLWPITAEGLRPQDSQSCASAYSTANRAGCVKAVSSIAASPSPSAAGSNSTDSSGRSRCASSPAAQRSSAARNTGSLACSSRAMPAYCAPCPVNRKASLGARTPALPVSTCASPSPLRWARRRRAASGASAATSARRCAKGARPVWALKPTSANDASPRSRVSA